MLCMHIIKIFSNIHFYSLIKNQLFTGIYSLAVDQKKPSGIPEGSLKLFIS